MERTGRLTAARSAGRIRGETSRGCPDPDGGARCILRETAPIARPRCPLSPRSGQQATLSASAQIVPRSRWTLSSNAPNAHEAHGFFWITHPYHPLSGQRFALVQYRHTWGEHRVYFHDHSGQLCSLPVPWTSLAPQTLLWWSLPGARCFGLLTCWRSPRCVAAQQQSPHQMRKSDDPHHL